MPASTRKPLLLRDYCLRTYGGQCRICLDACPHAALSLPTEEEANGSAANRLGSSSIPRLDRTRCTGCGICAGRCDAFALPGLSAPELLAKLRRIALAGERAVITCETCLEETRGVNHAANAAGTKPAAQSIRGEKDEAESAPTNVVTLPCLAALPYEVLLAASAHEIPLAVHCAFERCEHCEATAGTGEAFFAQALEHARAFTGREPDFCENLDDACGSNSATQSRRDAFSLLKEGANDLASGRLRLRAAERLRAALETQLRLDSRAGLELDDVPEANPYAAGGRSRKTLWPRRQVLLNALAAAPELAEYGAVPLCPPDEEHCTACLACTRVCPSGARSPDSETGCLTFDPRYCLGCGACLQACPQ